MRRVLEGCMYDTDTSELLATYCNSDDMTLRCARRETLYRKQSGQYWLFGEGGGGTEYGHIGPNGTYVPGYKVIPLSDKQARLWSEDNLDGDAYEAIWGPVSEDMPEAPSGPHYPLPGDPDYNPEQYMV